MHVHTYASQTPLIITHMIIMYANVYMCYDYVCLDNLSDISAYRTVVKLQRTAL